MLANVNIGSCNRLGFLEEDYWKKEVGKNLQEKKDHLCGLLAILTNVLLLIVLFLFRPMETIVKRSL